MQNRFYLSILQSFTISFKFKIVWNIPGHYHNRNNWEQRYYNSDGHSVAGKF